MNTSKQVDGMASKWEQENKSKWEVMWRGY